jgi:hypothetical protein
VFAPGVADHHFMLLWNGLVLTIVNVGAPNLWVDGKTFHLSTAITSARIQFGSAAIVVDRSLEDIALVSTAIPIAQQSEANDASKPGQ